MQIGRNRRRILTSCQFGSKDFACGGSNHKGKGRVSLSRVPASKAKKFSFVLMIPRFHKWLPTFHRLQQNQTTEIVKKMKPTKTIEFAPSNPINNQPLGGEKSPWESPKRGAFEDMILKPEYLSRVLKFPVGRTWFRIVPNLKSSSYGWMLGVFALKHEGSLIVHPKTLRKDRKSPFDLAYNWLKTNRPDALYSKANKEGLKLLSDPFCVFWALVEESGKTVARLFIGSGYDGSRGGAPGLGNQLLRLTQERDENQQLVANPVDAADGVLISVEKTQPPGARYPGYSVRVGNQPAPMSDFIPKMDDEEFAALCPLEQVIRELTIEEEWQCVAKIVGANLAAEIRASIS